MTKTLKSEYANNSGNCDENAQNIGIKKKNNFYIFKAKSIEKNIDKYQTENYNNFLSLKTKNASLLSGRGFFFMVSFFLHIISSTQWSILNVSLTFKSLSKILYR